MDTALKFRLCHINYGIVIKTLTDVEGSHALFIYQRKTY